MKKNKTPKHYAEALQTALSNNQSLLDNELFELEVRSRVVPIMDEQAYQLEIVLHYKAELPKVEINGYFSFVDDITFEPQVNTQERVYIILSNSGSLLASLNNRFAKAFRTATLSGPILQQAEQYTLDNKLPNYAILWEVNNDEDIITDSKQYFLIDNSGSANRLKEIVAPVYPALKAIHHKDFSRQDLEQWIDEGQSPTTFQLIQTYHPVTFLMRQTIPAIEWVSEQLASLAKTIEFAHIDPAFWKRSDGDYQNSVELAYKRLATRLRGYQTELNRGFIGIQLIIQQPEKLGTLSELALAGLEAVYPEYEADLIRLIERLRQAIDQVIGLILATMDDLIEHIAAFIAFLCGLWDAFVDAFSGIFHFLSFGFLNLKAWVKAIADPESAIDLLTELVDEFIQSLKAVAEKFFEGTLDELLEDTFNEVSSWMILQFEDIMHELGKSGIEATYYYGYFIYDVLEMAFPPLKLTRSAAVAAKVQKALTKVHPKLYHSVKGYVI